MQNQTAEPKKKKYLISVSPAEAKLTKEENKQLLAIIDRQLCKGVKIQLSYKAIEKSPAFFTGKDLNQSLKTLEQVNKFSALE